MKLATEVNEANFEAEVLNPNWPLLEDFWVERYGSCRLLAPVLDEIVAGQNGRVKVVKVNVGDHPGWAARFSVCSIPNRLHFVVGELRHQTAGLAGNKTILSGLGRLTAAKA